MIETLLFLILIIFIIIFVFININEVRYVESFNKNKYLVRNLPDKQDASNMIEEIRLRLKKLVDYLKIIDDKFMNKYKKTIIKKFPYIIYRESSSRNKYTSYSVNKGEQIVFCLRSKKDNSLHDINEIMYVAIHELAHVGCPEIGHTPLFIKINKKLLKYSVKLGIYKYINYNIKPKKYCGIVIDNTLL